VPTRLTPQLDHHAAVGPVKVCAQDEPRLGLRPVVRRQMPAGGVPPGATVTDQCDNFDLYGAGAPTTGASVFLALPDRHSRACQRWVDGFAAAFPESLQLVGRAKGAGPHATAGRWPSNVVPVFLPP
jgi:hypothetical protein